MTANAHTLLAEIERDVLNEDVHLASILRKCIVLAGRADAGELRSWATKELRGYEVDDTVPDYREVGAPISIDAVAGMNRITGQNISPRVLPDFVRDRISDKYTFYVGIGEIEATIVGANNTHVRLSLPGATDIAAIMNRDANIAHQQITAVYWTVAVSALRAILDNVRTTLAEMVAELHVIAPDSPEPDAKQIDKAISVAVEGSGHTINVLAPQDSSQATVGAPAGDMPPDSPFWTRGRKIGAFIVGAATVLAGAATIFAALK
ncbi:AbiTii domain-containing protein [Streptomyces argenteolus]|uniref:AbiTii domain-containing protein n=1 Tax=Streptomyces sp. NPDC025273 TaxID=3155251 RepID=UPI0033C53793